MTPTAPFYVVSGTLPLTSQSYVARQADKDLLSALLAGEYCFVLNSRQMGKSSLAVRTMAKLQEAGVRTVFLDLTKIGGSNVTPEQWYIGLLSETGRALGLRKEFLDYWRENSEYSLVQRYIGALHDVALGSTAPGQAHYSAEESPGNTGPSERLTPNPTGFAPLSTERPTPNAQRPTPSLVLFVDEIDAVRSLSFSTDEFFAAIRECYNRRVHEPEYGRLAFALIGSATASDLIQDTRTSPFNIGKRIELKDFTLQEAMPLATGLISRGAAETRRGESHKDTKAQEKTHDDTAIRLLDRVFYWTNGHPFLTQALCAEMSAALSDPTLNNRSPRYGSGPLNPPILGDLGGRSASNLTPPPTPNAERLTPALVDHLVASMFFEAKARERNVNLADVSNRILSSYLDSDRKEEHRAAILDLYRQVLSRRSKVADDETNRLVAVLKLSGITTTIDGELRVRNRIYEHVFDRAWIEQNMPDAERRRQKAAYRRGMLRTAELSAAVLAVDTILAGVAFVKAREARTAEAKANRTSREAQKVAYFATIQLIQGEYDAENYPHVVELLEATKDYAARGIEWDYWNRLMNLQILTLTGHTDRVNRAVFSPDGRQILTASSDGTASIWDATTGYKTGELKGATGLFWSAAFSPDGRQVVTAGGDNTARVWDVVTRHETVVLKGHTQTLESAVFSPGGMQIVTASDDGTARIWVAMSGHETAELKGHTDVVERATFSSDGQRIVTASHDGTARLWDAVTGRETARFTGHRTGLTDAAFSPDGQRIVTASADKTARVWDVATTKETTKFEKHKHFVRSAAFSPDGGRIVTASTDATARIWEPDTGRQILTLKGHIRQVNTAAFSPDGRRIVTAGWDGVARVWDAETDRDNATLKGHKRDVRRAGFSPDDHKGGVRRAAFSPDGRRIVTASADGTSQVWDAAAGRATAELIGHTKEVASAAFSPDGRRIVTASADSTARVWDVETGLETARLIGHTKAVDTAVFSPDGRRIVTASRDNSARIWDAATGTQTAALTGHKDEVQTAMFSPDGRRIVTASRDHTAWIWDTATGLEITKLIGHTKDVKTAIFSPDGRRVVTTANDHTARIWDTPTGRSLKLNADAPQVRFAAFSPDGRRVVTAGMSTIGDVWDAETGRPVALLKGHTDYVWRVAFSPDGKRIVTAGGDGTARVWDADTGADAAILKGHEDQLTDAVFSPDGKRILTASQDGTARIWFFGPDHFDWRAYAKVQAEREKRKKP